MTNAISNLNQEEQIEEIQLLQENIMQNVLKKYKLLLERLQHLETLPEITEDERFLLLAEIVNPVENEIV